MRALSKMRPSDCAPGPSEHDPIRRLDRLVSRVLAVGLATAILLLLTGAVMALAGRGPSPSTMTSVTDLPRALGALEPGGFLDLGLLVLLATPVARVLALAAGFARAKSWFFCGVSILVLVLLAVSAYLGVSG